MRIHAIPTTTRQAFKILDAMLSAKETQSILSKGKERFLSDEFFGLGLWIRNNWIYGDKEGIGLFASKEELPILDHPDYQSSVFLEKYYDHLKRQQKFK